MSTMTDKTIKISSHGEMKFHIERYDTVSEMVRDCKERRITDSSFDDKTKQNYSKSFNGVSNYNEALALLDGGYQPTVDAMRGVFKVTERNDIRRFKIENSVQGFAPVVPLALKGVPNNMLNTYITPMKAKVLSIYYDMCCSWSVDSKDIIKAGEKILSMVIELEKQGYRFNIYGCQTYTDSISADMLVVKIKDSTQPVDLKRISFPLAHVAFFRVLGFDWYSKCPGAKYRGGYGKALHYQLKRDQKIENEAAVQLFGIGATYFSAATIVEKLNAKDGDEYIKEMLTNAECKKR